MKGLLVKDMKLLKMQKKFFFLLIAIAVAMAVFAEDPAFLIGYFSIVMPLVAVSTVSYDEFDNGNAFLFTLPISRRGYVLEKYGFCLILGICAFLFACLLALTVGVFKNFFAAWTAVKASLPILAVMTAFLSLLLPVQLKFGAEKGRLIAVATAGILFVVGVLCVKGLEWLNVDIMGIADRLIPDSLLLAAVFIAAIALLLLGVSVSVSLSILKKKEF